MTAEQPAHRAPVCRHLLTVRGGTLGCTLPHGHTPPTVHADGGLADPEHPDRHPSWSCTCPPAPGVTVCSTFEGYT